MRGSNWILAIQMATKLICLTQPRMISSTVSRSTPVTYYSHICL